MDAVLPEPDPALCRALAADLRDAGFDCARRCARRGATSADDAIARGLRAPAIRALGDRADPLAVLGRLLVLGMPQPRGRGRSGAAAHRRRRARRARARGIARTAIVTPLALVRPQSFADDRGSGAVVDRQRPR